MANIRTARRSGLVLRGGRNIRDTIWVGGVYLDTTIASPSTAILVTGLNAAALARRPFTVIRVRGILSVRSDQSAAVESQLAAWGKCVVSDQAVAVGVTAVPTPATDNASDLWFAYESLQNLGDIAAGPQQIETRFIDGKGMRKVDGDQDVVTVIETAAISSGCTITTFDRLLIKLH